MMQFQQKLSSTDTYYIFGNTIHITWNNEISELMMNHYRRGDDSIFDGHTSLDSFYDVINEIYGNIFSHEDCVITCGSDNLKKYHDVITRIKIDDNAKFIITLMIDDNIQSFEQGSGDNIELNLNIFCEKLISKIILKIFFDCDGEFDTFAITRNMYSRMKSIVNKKFSTSQHISNNEIQFFATSVLHCNPTIFNDKTLTVAQRIVMIFVILFASHENIVESLKYMIFEMINSKPEKKNINKMLNDFVPVFGIGRIIKKDLVIVGNRNPVFENSWTQASLERDPVFENSWAQAPNERNSEYFVMKTGDIFCINNDWMTDKKYIFGLGPHKCPGKKFSCIILDTIVSHIRNNYDLNNIRYQNDPANKNVIIHVAYLVTKKITDNFVVDIIKK